MTIRHAKPYPSKEAAENSKKGRTGDYDAVQRACGCEGNPWHLEPKGKSAATERKPQRHTGPDRVTRLQVLTRDGFACARCGKPCGPGIAPYSLQHRKARGVGGDSSAPNLVLLDGTATTGCHGEVESRRDPHDLARGYRLESWQNPEAEPVMYFSPGGSGFTAWLLRDGSLSFDGPGVAA